MANKKPLVLNAGEQVQLQSGDTIALADLDPITAADVNFGSTTNGYAWTMVSGSPAWAPVTASAGGNSLSLQFNNSGSIAGWNESLVTTGASGGPALNITDVSHGYIKVSFDVQGSVYFNGSSGNIYRLGSAGSLTMSWFGVSEVAQQTAPTAITDSTGGSSGSTCNNCTVSDSTGGSAGGTLSGCGDTTASDQSVTINNNFASVAAKLATLNDNVATILARLAAARTLLVNYGLGS